MGFFHFRIKKYIEIRVADSVPLERALGYVALLKGLIYSDKNIRLLDEILSIVTDLDSIQNAVEEIEKNGFDAIIYNGRSALEWSEQLYNLAESALDAEDKEYLKGVRTFWNNSKQENPNKQPA